LPAVYVAFPAFGCDHASALAARSYSRCEVELLYSIGFVLGADLGIARLEKANGDLLLELETRKLVERRKGILQ